MVEKIKQMKKKREEKQHPRRTVPKPNRGSVTVASFTTTPTGKQRQQESARWIQQFEI
jgi:hypothetical protein